MKSKSMIFAESNDQAERVSLPKALTGAAGSSERNTP